MVAWVLLDEKLAYRQHIYELVRNKKPTKSLRVQLFGILWISKITEKILILIIIKLTPISEQNILMTLNLLSCF